MDDLNPHRRDTHDMKKFMGAKKDSLGMKDSTIKFEPNAKKDPSQRLWYWTRVVQRNFMAENGKTFSGTNAAWRAINADIVNRQANVKKHPESEKIDSVSIRTRPIPTFTEFE